MTVLAGDIVETRKAFESFSVRRVDISRFASAGAGRKKSRDQVVCPVRFLQETIRSHPMKRGERFLYRAKRAGFSATLYRRPCHEPYKFPRPVPSCPGKKHLRSPAAIFRSARLHLSGYRLSGPFPKHNFQDSWSAPVSAKKTDRFHECTGYNRLQKTLSSSCQKSRIF